MNLHSILSSYIWNFFQLTDWFETTFIFIFSIHSLRTNSRKDLSFWSCIQLSLCYSWSFFHIPYCFEVTFSNLWILLKIINFFEATFSTHQFYGILEATSNVFISLKLNLVYFGNTWSYIHRVYFLEATFNSIGNTWSFFHFVYLFLNLELLPVNLRIYFIEAIFDIFWKYLELLPFYIFIPKPGTFSSELILLEPHSNNIWYIWSFFQLTSLFEATFKLHKEFISLKLHSILFLVHFKISSINLLYWSLFHYSP